MKIRNKLAALLTTLCMTSMLTSSYAYAEQPVDNTITTETTSELTNEKPVRFLKLSRKKPEKLLMRKYSGIWT